jgi:hypothetical protein
MAESNIGNTVNKMADSIIGNTGDNKTAGNYRRGTKGWIVLLARWQHCKQNGG